MTTDYGNYGRTIVAHFCDTCPPLSDWPHKHLILGTCPRCGKRNARAWRLAAAQRIIEQRNAS